MLRLLAVGAALLSLLSACGPGSQGVTPPEDEGIARIVVTPGTLLLVEAGDTAQLTAQAYDQAGNPVEASISWRSLSEDAATVTAGGLVTAVAIPASAQVVATADGVESAPVLVVLARPVAGAVLVDDQQITAGPTPIEADAELELGMRYTVSLTGTGPLTPGTVVLARGEAALAGRVVETGEPAGPNGALEVTLEVIGVDELFEELVIDESLDMTNSQLELSGGLQDDFAAKRLGPGEYQLIADPDQVWTLDQGLSPSQAQGTRALGPFECSTSQSFPQLSLTGVGLSSSQSLSFDFRYDSDNGGLQRLVASGQVKVEFTSAIKFTASYEGKLTCQGEIFQFTIPIGGPLALIFGGHVPIGAGFEYNGKITVAQVGVELKATTEHTVQIGVDCQGGASCQMVNTYTPNNTAEFKPILPAPSSQFRAEFSVFGYGFIDLSFGNRFFRTLRFQAFTIRGGLKETLNLAPDDVQAADAAYASEFKRELEFSAGTGRSIQRLLNLLKVDFLKIELKQTLTLAESPKGSLDVTTGHNHSEPTHVRPGASGETGDLAEFVVNLNGTEYAGLDIVESISIYRREESGELVAIGPACSEVTSAGTSFSCETDFSEDFVGDNDLYAFIDVQFLGVSLPISLEIAKDGKAELTVDPEPELGAITVSPQTVKADTWTLQTFQLPYVDAGKNLSIVRDDFVLLPEGGTGSFEATIGVDTDIVAGFEAPSGTGEYRVDVFVGCDQRGNGTLRDTFTLIDDLDHRSQEVPVDTHVDFSDCPAASSLSTGSVTPTRIYRGPPDAR